MKLIGITDRSGLNASSMSRPDMQNRFIFIARVYFLFLHNNVISLARCVNYILSECYIDTLYVMSVNKAI